MMATANTPGLIHEVRAAIGFPDACGISEFTHPNPSIANRELSGQERLHRVNRSLSANGQGRIVQIVYDLPTPKSEGMSEGGGDGIVTPRMRKGIRTIADPAAHYWMQTPFRDFESRIPADVVELPDVRQLVQLHQMAMKSSATASDYVLRLRQITYGSFGLPADDLVTASSLFPRMAAVLRVLDEHRIPWMQVPLRTSSSALFHLLDDNGRPDVDVAPQSAGQAVTVRHGEKGDTISKATLLRQLETGRARPSFELYLLTMMIAPAWLHFGNLYGRHEPVVNWFAQFTGTTPWRISGDYQNSIPLGPAQIRRSRGWVVRALTSVDMSLRPPSEIWTAVMSTAETGAASLPFIDQNRSTVLAPQPVSQQQALELRHPFAGAA
jgi:hypothetical protein